MLRQLKITKSFTRTNGDVAIKSYLTEIGKYDTLSVDEEVELAQQIRKGDRSARDKLIKANLRFVVSVAKQYHCKGVELIDLINEGNMGLIHAVEKYDETKGFKLISYAVWWIRQNILDYLGKNGTSLYMPGSAYVLKNKIAKFESHFEQYEERLPTIAEIADFLEEDKERIIEVKRTDRFASLDSHIDTNDSTSPSVYESVADEDTPDTDYLTMEDSLKEDVDRCLEFLTLREQTMIRMFFGIGYDQEYTRQEIALKFGCSTERVRQIHAKVLRKLGKGKSKELLKKYV